MRDFEECQPFVDHIFSEHRHLAQRLLRVQSLFVDNKRPPQQEDLLAETLSLREELARHFREEEEGGCLDEAVAHCPRLGTEADDIEKEHADLLSRLDKVMENLEENTGAKGFQEAAADFHLFVGHILDHENRENKVMAEAFGTVWTNENGETCNRNRNQERTSK